MILSVTEGALKPHFRINSWPLYSDSPLSLLQLVVSLVEAFPLTLASIENLPLSKITTI
jgi:hypothetical protein